MTNYRYIFMNIPMCQKYNTDTVFYFKCLCYLLRKNLSLIFLNTNIWNVYLYSLISKIITWFLGSMTGVRDGSLLISGEATFYKINKKTDLTLIHTHNQISKRTIKPIVSPLCTQRSSILTN